MSQSSRRTRRLLLFVALAGPLMLTFIGVLTSSANIQTTNQAASEGRPVSPAHEFHNTVSLIRTMEILLGIPPMNQLDATATPIDLFRDEVDLRPYKAQLPDISLDNLMTAPARDAVTAQWIKLTAEQDMTHADMADPGALNRIIWFSVRGTSVPMPEVARLPAFDAMLVGIAEEEEGEEEQRHKKTEVARDEAASPR